MVAINSILTPFRRTWLRILLLFVIFFSISMLAAAEGKLEFNTHFYDFGPGLRILKPSLNFSNQFSADTTLTGRFTVDRVKTDAVVDSVSGASQYLGNTQARTDVRQEYLAGIAHAIGDWKLEAGYVLSMEEDYRSNSPSIVVSKDFNQRNTTVSFGYGHNYDWVKGSYMREAKEKDVDNISLAITQILSRTSLIQAGYSMQYNQGFLSTGNRQVILDNGLLYDEYLPGTRQRQAIGGRYAKWLPTKTSVQVAYRYYQDNWDLDSHTMQFLVNQSLSNNIKLRGEYRYYTQTGASFSKENYDGSERYLTSASSLRAFDSRLVGLKLMYKARWSGQDWQVEGKFEHYAQTSGLGGKLMMFGISEQF